MNLNRRGGTMSLSGKWGIDPKITADRNSYFFKDNLDYANAGAAAAAGWIDAGTPIWHYTTSPAPLDGVSSSSFATDSASDRTYFSIPPQDDVWAYVIVNVSAFTNNPYLVEFRDSSDVQVAGLRMLSSGTVAAGIAGSTTNGSGGFSTGTLHCWIRFLKGSGSNSKCYVYVNTSPVLPAITAQKINGGITTQASRISLYPSASTTVCIWNKLRVSAAPIGSNPI